MKTSVAVFLTGVFMVALGSAAFAEEAPVALTQTLTGYANNGRTVTLDYAVQVKNQRKASLGPLTLTLVPQTPFLLERRSYNLDKLGPNAVANVKVTVVTPLLLDQKYFSRMPLRWAGKCTEAEGKLSEFPVTSRMGGAK